MPNAKKTAKKRASKLAKKTAKKAVAHAAAKPATKATKKATKPRPTKPVAASSAKPSKIASKRKGEPTPSASPDKGRPVMANKPTSIDDYLRHVDPATRKLLQALRETIVSLVPEAEECISYAMPAFRWQGKVIGGFAATRDGGSYYPFSGSTLDTLGDALAGYSRTKSGLHFTSDKPLPRTLVKTLLDARMAEVEG